MKTRIFIFILIVFSGTNFPQNFQWFKIGNGIQYTVTENKKGNDILVAIGGWKAKQEWVNKWCSELYKSNLNELGIQHIFSVKGPDVILICLELLGLI
jgi:hypothetical protein